MDDAAPAVDAFHLNHLEQGVYDAHEAIAAFQGVPTGVIIPFAAAAAPAGWLLCDGSAVSRTTYSTLHALLKDVGGVGVYAYGSGDGSTTFNLPDFRGRTPVGKGTHTEVDALAESDGLAVGTRTPKHNSAVNDPGHSHAYARDVQSLTPGGTAFTTNNPVTHDYATDSSLTGITVGPGGTRPVDLVPFLVVNFVIKT